MVKKADTDVQKRIVAAEKMDIVAKLQAMANQQGQPGKDGKDGKDGRKELTGSSGKKGKKDKAGGSLLKKKGGAISAGFATLKRSSVLKDSRDEDGASADSPAKERKKAKPEPVPEPEPEPEVPKRDPMEYWNELNVPEPKLLVREPRLGGRGRGHTLSTKH